MHRGYLLLWAFTESVGAGSCDWGILGGIGGGLIGEFGVWRAGDRYRWKHTVSFGLVRDGGVEADRRACVDSRDYSLQGVGGSLRSDGTDRRGCCADAWADGGV